MKLQEKAQVNVEITNGPQVCKGFFSNSIKYGSLQETFRVESMISYSDVTSSDRDATLSKLVILRLGCRHESRPYQHGP